MELPEYRIIQRTMHGGRVWLIPQFRAERLPNIEALGIDGWNAIPYNSGVAEFDVTDPKDVERGMEKAQQAIRRHKDKYTLDELTIWPEATA